ncbi:MAG: HU family DNA-binding protein [Spirochaetia bacterium]|nr:HU family DNA-binding protein [Spirochaetia bacterium]
MVKKVAKKKKTTSQKFSFIDEVIEGVLEIAETARDGSIKIKKTEMKKVLENVFENAALTAARGDRVRFPIIGILSRKDVAARKAGKGINRFTGEEIMISARPASKKPRWSFPKATKEIFAAKKNW